MARIAGMHPSDSPDYRRLEDLCIETLGFVPNSVLMMLRVALELALVAGQVPKAVDDALFRRLRAYWNEEQILEIVGVVAMFGFLNRWNDTLACRWKSSRWMWRSAIWRRMGGRPANTKPDSKHDWSPTDAPQIRRPVHLP